MSGLYLLFTLLMGHAVADFALQSDAMAQGKRGGGTVPAGQKPQVTWVYWLTAHSLIHGAAVMVITGGVYMAAFATAAHILVDFGKTRNHYGIHVDQTLHLVTLAIIALVYTLVGAV